MKTIQIKIREHEETGENGIKIVGGRDYHEPATSGLQFAHDIMEHTVTPHNDPVIDELMAFGGGIAGRIAHFWDTGYNGVINFDSIRSGILSLAEYKFHSNDDMNITKCNSYIQDKDLMGDIYEAILEAKRDFRDNFSPELMIKFFDERAIAGWICKGYQAYKKRFRKFDPYGMIVLFDDITKKADNFLHNEIGTEGVIHIDFANSFCTFGIKYEDYE